jgi:CBS domain-containing protein
MFDGWRLAHDEPQPGSRGNPEEGAMAMLAKDLMSTTLRVVPPEMPVTAVAELLSSHGISGVPVVDESGAPLGIITEGRPHPPAC